MTSPPTTCRTKRKSQRYQQRCNKQQFGKAKKEQAVTIATEEKAYQLRSEQVTTTIEYKIKQQFGFIADPKKTLLHNASSALANTPTWYYFSRPSHLAFHDFSPRKTYVHYWALDSNLSRHYNVQTYGKIWEKPQCPSSNMRSIYASTLQEQPILPMSPMTQKCIYGPIGPPHTGPDHPLS